MNKEKIINRIKDDLWEVIGANVPLEPCEKGVIITLNIQNGYIEMSVVDDLNINRVAGDIIGYNDEYILHTDFVYFTGDETQDIEKLYYSIVDSYEFKEAVNMYLENFNKQ